MQWYTQQCEIFRFRYKSLNLVRKCGAPRGEWWEPRGDSAQCLMLHLKHWPADSGGPCLGPHKRLSPQQTTDLVTRLPLLRSAQEKRTLGWHQAALQSSAQRPQPPPAHPAAYQRPWRCLLFLPVPSGKLSDENRTGSLRSCGCQVLASPQLVGLLKTRLEQAEPGCLATLRGQRVPRSQRSGLNARSRARGGRARAGSQGERVRLAARRRNRAKVAEQESRAPIPTNPLAEILGFLSFPPAILVSQLPNQIQARGSLSQVSGQKALFQVRKGTLQSGVFLGSLFSEGEGLKIGFLVCLCLFLFSPLVIRLATLSFSGKLVPNGIMSLWEKFWKINRAAFACSGMGSLWIFKGWARDPSLYTTVSFFLSSLETLLVIWALQSHDEVSFVFQLF